MSTGRRTAAVVLGATALVGCGESAAQGEPRAIIEAAPDRTLAAGPAQIIVERFGLRAEGVLDLSRDAVRLTVDTTPEERLDVLAIGERTWTRPTGTSTWTVSEQSAGLLSLPGGLISGDPRAAMALVLGAKEIKVFGGLQVQQTSTVRYDLQTDPGTAAPKAAPGARRAIEALDAAIDHTIRVDTYIDGDGRIRRLEVPEDLRTSTPDTRFDGNRISATVDLVRFGVPADDLVPPA